LAAAALAAAASVPPAAQAAITFQVTFDDPGGTYAAYYDRIRSNLVAAGNEWASYYGNGHSASLQVQLSFSDVATVSTASVANWFVRQSNGYSIYEQGAAYEILTGKDPNGTTPDIRMTIGRNGYLQNELWFDPSPSKQTATVPANRTDARSVFLHELGHALAFNGWRNAQTGALPGAYESTFDAMVTAGTFNGQPQLYFTGPSARALFGGPVPLTVDSYGHLGNAAPGAGSGSLASDLMNGLSFSRGTRYHVSQLDLAILADTGFPTSTQLASLGNAALAVPLAGSVPEPSTWMLMAGGLAVCAWIRRRVEVRPRA
jgi:hypothetical protein